MIDNITLRFEQSTNGRRFRDVSDTRRTEVSEQTWRQLFERHFNAVHRFCMALADGRDGMAEELAQQVNVIAARRIYRFDTGQFAGSKINYELL